MPIMMMDGSWLISKYKDASFVFENNEVFSSNRTPILLSEVDVSAKRVKFVNAILEKWIMHQDINNDVIKNEIVKDIFSYVKDKMPTYVNSTLNQILEEKKNKDVIDFKKEIAVPIFSGLVLDMLDVKVTSVHQLELTTKHCTNISILINKLKLDHEDVTSLSTSLLYLIRLGNDFDGSHDDFQDELYTDDFSAIDIQKTIIFSALLHDTTNMLCNVYYVLHQNKDLIDFGKLKNAVKEATRLESPVQTISRVATQDVEIDGLKINKGDSVSVFIGSTNRDESIKGLENSNEFNPNRKVQLLSFGKGVHYCLGQHLAMPLITMIIDRLLNQDIFQIVSVKWDDSLRNYRVIDEFIVKS